MGGQAVARTDLPLPLLRRGKVRDLYEAGPDHLLLVASDRISAFDVILSPPIPRKGEVLTLLTAWWLSRIEEAAAVEVGHHLVAVDPDEIEDRLPGLAPVRERWARRSMLVRRADPLPVECVVRGYLSGSAWREYAAEGTLAGEPLPEGLVESAPLDPPIFSPATKAEEGHDENIPFREVVVRLGEERARRLRDLSLELYRFGAGIAEERAILLADTKFEFGTDGEGGLLLIDEVLTPDSSRYWPRETYREGRPQPSLDKQPVRDWLDDLPDWDKSPPAPELTDAVVEAATRRYLEVFRRLTGTELDAFPLPSFQAEA